MKIDLNQEIAKVEQEMICPICKKYPKNNCSICNDIKKAFKLGKQYADQERSEERKRIIEIIDKCKVYPLELEDGHETRGLDINELKSQIQSQHLNDVKETIGGSSPSKCGSLVSSFSSAGTNSDRDKLIEQMKNVLDELYKKHSNKVSHTFVFLVKEELDKLKSNRDKT